MAIASITDFFEEIIRDLHASLYLALGGSLEEDNLDFSEETIDRYSY